MFNKINFEKIEKVLKTVPLFVFLLYVIGFVAWNSYLLKFGFFEYNLLQTRFISAGLLFVGTYIGSSPESNATYLARSAKNAKLDFYGKL